eukprot:snap_masked-scaffold_86-processed-gene-0.19-mRNA-1 protein AED:1.00 eAED:1.00 QI:0/0/0/0/1/1/2/0/79
MVRFIFKKFNLEAFQNLNRVLIPSKIGIINTASNNRTKENVLTIKLAPTIRINLKLKFLWIMKYNKGPLEEFILGLNHY